MVKKSRSDLDEALIALLESKRTNNLDIDIARGLSLKAAYDHVPPGSIDYVDMYLRDAISVGTVECSIDPDAIPEIDKGMGSWANTTMMTQIYRSRGFHCDYTGMTLKIWGWYHWEEGVIGR